MRTIVEQLREAYEKAHDASRMTMDDLLEKSGLDIDRSSLRRKLLDVKDPIPMKTEEAEAIARALDHTLVWVPEEPPARKSRAS